MSEIIVDSFFAGDLDILRRGEIGFADRKIDNVDTFGFKLFGLGRYPQRGRFADPLNARRPC